MCVCVFAFNNLSSLVSATGVWYFTDTVLPLEGALCYFSKGLIETNWHCREFSGSVVSIMRNTPISFKTDLDNISLCLLTGFN